MGHNHESLEQETSSSAMKTPRNLKSDFILLGISFVSRFKSGSKSWGFTSYLRQREKIREKKLKKMLDKLCFY